MYRYWQYSTKNYKNDVFNHIQYVAERSEEAQRLKSLTFLAERGATGAKRGVRRVPSIPTRALLSKLLHNQSFAAKKLCKNTTKVIL